MPILPMSCSNEPRRIWIISTSLTPMIFANFSVIAVTRSVCPSVSFVAQVQGARPTFNGGVVRQHEFNIEPLQSIQQARVVNGNCRLRA